jgi:hypothetical protein
MPAVAPSLADARARWSRAGHHVSDLSDACQDLIKSYGFCFDSECDDSGFGTIFYVDQVAPALLREASTLFGKVVSNLWTARNYVVWQVACLRDRTDLPSAWRNLSFPVMKTEPTATETFRGRAAGQLTGFRRADFDKIEAVQPYQTGPRDPATGLRQADTAHPHYILEELAKLDRHRRLAVLPLYPVALTPDVKLGKGVGEVLYVRPDPSRINQPLRDGDVVAHFRIKFVTACEVAVTPGALLQVFPGDVVPVGGGDTFDIWVRRLQTAVMDLIEAFEPEFG